MEPALNSGQTLKDIWQALETEGLQVSYHTFQMAVWRAKRKQTAASSCENEKNLMMLAGSEKWKKRQRSEILWPICGG